MDISYWCVLIAGVMPAMTVVIAKWGRRDFDNANPRQWLEQQDGIRRRADSAHRNHFEAFPFFAAAVIIAHLHDVAPHLLNALAIGFIAARLAYTVCYLTNRATLRSLCWVVAYLCIVALFLLAAFP